MSNNEPTAPDREARLEKFAAELTSVVYPLVLRRGPKGAWLQIELGLWQALTETVRKWARQPPPAAAAVAAWREGLLTDLTDSACHIALRNGIRGSLLDLEVCLYRAIRLVTRRYGRGRSFA